MTEREKLLQIVERLPERDISVAHRVLSALACAPTQVAQSLLLAPLDDEPDDDDFDGGLTEALREVEAGDVLPAEEVKRVLGIK